MAITHLTQISLNNLYTLDSHDADIMENDNTEQRQNMKKLIAAVMDNSLTDRQRQIVKMYFFERKNMPQIAIILGIKAPTVSITLKRAMEKFEKNKKIFEKVRQ